ncbi:unnamed protein product, partial [Oikopleura dioica]
FHGEGRRSTTQNQNLKCKYCNFYAKDNHALEQHLRLHENRLFRCQYCNYTTANMHHLRDHFLHHFHIRNFSCDICKLTFITKPSLKNHERTHTKDWTCVSCYQTLNSRKLYDSHVRSCEVRLSKLK